MDKNTSSVLKYNFIKNKTALPRVIALELLVSLAIFLSFMLVTKQLQFNIFSVLNVKKISWCTLANTATDY